MDSGGWKSRMNLVPGVVLAIVGVNLLSFSSLRLFTLAATLLVVGLGLFLRALFRGSNRSGLLFRKRRELALALGAAIFSIAATVLGAALIRMPATARFIASAERFDADLGWTGNTDATTVGTMRMKIDPAKRHVLFVGDSVLYGFGVPFEDNFAVRLNERYSNYQALNAAVSGYSIDQYYITMQREVPRIKPEVTVIGLFAGNDFQLTSRDYGWGHSKPLFVLDGDRLVRVTGDLTGDNCVDRLAQSLLFRVLWSNREFAESMLHTFCHPRELPESETTGVIRKMFQEMEELARANGSRLLFLLLPDMNDFPNVGDDEYLRYRSRYGDLRDLVVEGGHELMENMIPLAESGANPRELYIDTAHLNARGHQIMADALFEELKKRDGIGS